MADPSTKYAVSDDFQDRIASYAARIDQQLACANDIGVAQHTPYSPQHRSHPGNHLTRREGLDDIVVGP